jgi:hypothetical protein
MLVRGKGQSQFIEISTFEKITVNAFAASGLIWSHARRAGAPVLSGWTVMVNRYQTEGLGRSVFAHSLGEYESREDAEIARNRITRALVDGKASLDLNQRDNA